MLPSANCSLPLHAGRAEGAARSQVLELFQNAADAILEQCYFQSSLLNLY
jgi:hypothetical protein